MLWFRSDNFVRRRLSMQRLIAFGVVTYILLSISSVTPLGWDSDTGLLLERPRTDAPDWYSTFATTAHPFGLLVQHLYLDFAEILGVSDVVAWKFMLGGCFLIQAVYIRVVFGWRALNLFFVTVTTFPSLWRNLLSLEEEIIGMTLFMWAGLGLIRTVLDEDHQSHSAAESIQSGETHAKIPTKSTIVGATAACLWHFQYWYILSVVIVCLALLNFIRKGAQRKQLLVWATLTASYLPLFHILGIIRSTPYHDVFSSLPKHLEAGEPTHEWFAGVVRCLFWHGEPYVNDGLFPFVVSGTMATMLLGRIFLTRHFQGRMKALLGILLAASFSLPVLYEPTSSERWLPFWTIVSVCGVAYISSRERLASSPASREKKCSTEQRLAKESARESEILRHRATPVLLAASVTIISFNAATWHSNFSTSHLMQWSDRLREMRCQEYEKSNFSAVMKRC